MPNKKESSIRGLNTKIGFLLDENYFFHQCDDAIFLKTPFISQKIQKIIPQIPLETVKILSEI